MEPNGEPENRAYTYVIVRKDLPVYYQIIQAGHAIQEMMLGLHELDSETNKIRKNYMCLLEVKNEQELMRAYSWIESCGINCHMFYEPDYETGYTAVASEPIPWDDVESRKVFDRFRMYK